MADEDEATTESNEPEDHKDVQVTQPASEQGSELAATPPSSAIIFPIEGDSKWVTIMRSLAIATAAGIFVIAGVFHFLTGDDGFVETQQLGMIFGGIIFLLILEYFVFLRVVIPRQADYGRYAIKENEVDFYPLTPLGLSISPHRKPENITKFMGLTTRPLADKKGKVSYAVYLVHKMNKGKTINVVSFSTPDEADSYAAKLGAKLRLNVASGIRAQKKRAL